MTGVGRAAGGPLRVLVVDDSIPMRAVLVELLDNDPELEVVGTAGNGLEAIREAARIKPDVITMDLRMPIMDGLEASRRIMQEVPTPIVMVTASVSRGEQGFVGEALQAGVLAIVEKPMDSSETERLVQTVKNMARVKVVRRRVAAQPQRGAPAAPVLARMPHGPPQVVAIGASTGGPQALHQILAALPSSFSASVLVVQHIAPGFVAGMVEWLRPRCALPVQQAASGIPLDRPGVYLAPTGRHLTARERRVALTMDPPVSGHRPSATVLFQSVAREYGPRAVGVLLTGMGEDGANGLGDMKRAGAVTIAQDEASSVVFGMPSVAIQLRAVDHILPPESIAVLLVELAGRSARAEP